MAKITYKISECWRYGPQFEDDINKGFNWVVEITLMRGGKDYKLFHSEEGCERFIESRNVHKPNSLCVNIVTITQCTETFK